MGVIRRWLPVFEWLPGYRREDLPGDLVAGLTGAAILVPQSMAYARIAGLPPVVGLYASVVPIFVYAVFGRSRQLSVGPLATISIMAAATVGHLAAAGSHRYIQLMATLALLVGLVHVFLGLTRLGFLLRFLSEPVMSGFISAVGLIIIGTQLAGLFGLQLPHRSLFDQTVWDWLTHLDETHVATLALAAASIAVLLLGRRWRRLPVALILLVVTTALSAVFDFQSHGIAVVGSVPKGLAGPDVPPLSWDLVEALLPVAVAITFVGFLESITLARLYAAKHDYTVDTDQELVALGMSNASAGLFQGMIVTGAVTRSSILDEAGARTQLSGVIAGAIVVPLLLFFTGAFTDIPVAVLAAIVVVAVLGFLKVGEARRLWHVKRADFWMMTLTFVATVLLGLERGVIIAVAASIVLLIARAMLPGVVVLGRRPGTDAFLSVARNDGLRTYDGTLIVRVNAPLSFVNAEALDHRLRRLEPTVDGLRAVVIDASGIDDLDATADHTLRRTVARYQGQGIDVSFVNVNARVLQVMEASGLAEMVGPDRFFATDADAIAHLERTGGR